VSDLGTNQLEGGAVEVSMLDDDWEVEVLPDSTVDEELLA